MGMVEVMVAGPVINGPGRFFGAGIVPAQPVRIA